MSEHVWRPFSDYAYKKPWRIRDLLKQIRKDIKWSHQRIWKGYCDYDLYSIYDWFLEIMPPMLEEYKKKRHGSPVGKNKEIQSMIMTEEEREESIHTQWDNTLDRMVFLLREMNEKSNPYTDKYFSMISKYREGPIKEPDGSVSYRYAEVTEPADKELERKYCEETQRIDAHRVDCKKKFFELLSEHFYDLWD